MTFQNDNIYAYRNKKRVNYTYYHVAYTFSDGRIRCTEMGREKYAKTELIYKCVHKKC